MTRVRSISKSLSHILAKAVLWNDNILLINKAYYHQLEQDVCTFVCLHARLTILICWQEVVDLSTADTLGWCGRLSLRAGLTARIIQTRKIL